MKNKIMKKSLACLIAGAMVFGLTACAGKGSSSKADGDKVTISYANFNASGGNEKTLEKMYEEFQKEFPDIKVEIETMGFDDYFTQMQTRVAGGTAPDCYELNIENFAAYSSKDMLAEIEGVDSKAYNETALEAFSVDGKQYGVPGNFSNVVLVYNKDLFDQAGVEYPTNDWTWEDAQKAAEAIRSLGDDIYGIYAPTTYNEFYKVAAQYGGALLNEDKTKFTIDSKENIKAAKTMINRITESNVQPNAEQMGGMEDWDLFESGRLGMIPTGIWAFSTFKDACKFNWDICVEPGGTQKATHFFSNALVVNANTDDAKKKAASTWINWLASSDTAAKMRIEANWDLPAISNEDVLSKYLEQTPPDNKQAVFDSLDSLVMPPIIEDYSLMSDLIDKKLEEAANGKLAVEEALKQAQQECASQISLK